MRFRRLALVAIHLLCAVRTAKPADSAALLLVSIDGLRGDDVADADALGLRIPILRAIAAEGVSARRMVTIFPSLTYPAHATLVTGALPARHGILNNEIFDPLATGRLPWYFFARDIRVPTLWDAFRAGGRRTASIGWPVTVDARIDFNMPELWGAADFDGTFIPRSRAASTPGMIEDAERRFGFSFDPARLDEHRTLVARAVVERHRPDLLLVHYNLPDKKQHQLGLRTPEVLASIEQADALVGDLLGTYARSGYRVPVALPTTSSAPVGGERRLNVCVLSDHGFEEVSREFRPNVVLREAGLIDYDASASRVRSWRVMAWVGGGSAAIMAADSGDTEAIERARELLARDAGRPGNPVARALDKAEITRRGANPLAAFMLDPAEGWMFGRLCQGPVTGPCAPKGMHGQLPERPGMGAVFFLAGPGVPRGGKLETVRMVDVAPTLASLAGVTLPAPDGEIIPLK